LAFIIIFISTPGCRRAGRGGTGELVVPRQQLREIDGTDLADLAVAPPTTVPAGPTTVPTTLPAPPPAPEVRLDIEHVRRLALENNLDLRVELLNPTIARTDLGEEEARFEALLLANVDYATSDQPTASQLTSSEAEDFRAGVGLQVPLRTGGVVRLDVPVERFETNNEFSTLNPAFSSDYTASISQPLLRGGGVYANTQRVRVAFYNYQAAEARTKLEVIRVLADAERVYWRLYAARQELIVRKQEYDLAVAQLRRARNQVRAGAAARVEVIRAESAVADTVENTIIAENAVRDRQRELKRVVNAPDLDLGGPTVVVPATEPAAVYYKLDADRLTELALGGRMELLELELQIAREMSNVAFARNDALPLVTLDYTYNVNGLGDSFGNAFDLSRERDFEDHRVGLRVEVPIGNEAAHNRLRRALLNRLQRLATQEQRVLQIRQEVYNAVDQLEANWQRILATRQRVVLAARVLESETRRFNLELSTGNDVLDATTRLADARSAEIAAVTEYQIAQIDIAFATGTLLGASRVVWAPAGRND
jgi:outer membrane protein TolC